MADPTIQTFCCKHNNNTDMAIIIMQEFNTDVYNVVCMLSSIIGIIGAIYQILPREEVYNQYRWQNFSSSRSRKIIIWLAVADLFASLDMKLLLSERPGKYGWYHAAAWICPALLTTFGLSILYIPEANCHESITMSTAILRILPNYCVTYLLLGIVMIVNPVLYISSTKDLQNAVTCSMAQMTGRERKLVQTIQVKFAMINLVYYICWLPNLINGILLWILWFNLPAKVIIALWYVMAATNPLQAFFNAMVYQRWGKRERFFSWWKKLGQLVTTGKYNSNELNEVSPLLTPQYECCTPHTSINGSSSL
ncbi:hypothetical protein G9C98_004787 [Cotesia typhae]|uniref:Uncharacterized protein n=1 Tax=Cotesia typhae TaxID=2053667 RepID=A0A8J5QUL6_9HYME|nr:hypothetical protein G9C98_004787 [Cotesia typhae]